MRLIDYVQILFYVVLMLIAILVAAHAISVMREVSHDLQQGRLHHAELLRESRQALKDHEAFFLEHQAQMRLLQER